MFPCTILVEMGWELKFQTLEPPGCGATEMTSSKVQWFEADSKKNPN